MKTKAEEAKLGRGRVAKKRAVAVKLSQLAFEALAAEEPSGSPRAPVRTESAIRVYLGDKGAGQAAWPYPEFLRGSETQEDVDLELEVAPDLWLQFEAEAEKQGVSTQQLLEHAAFYFAAELNAGRITKRILDDLEVTEPQGD
ncbi:MAG TPA: hypothetical protein VEW07_03990 [Solirubrobacterales bacterium]|nr:hypothetical protein [Solirubrobacterales bacterium]